MIRDHVEASGGRLVNMTGDGSLSIFDGPARAIRCAQRLVESVESIDVEIRAGIHTGECEHIGDDIAGIAVHIGARVSAKAGAGEVWISRTVRDLVAGSGLQFQSRGEHELKGVDGVWELFSLESEHTSPIPVSVESSPLTGTDRAILTAARRAPSMLRMAGRIANRLQS
jgi:class 3 adenylate cyclase